MHREAIVNHETIFQQSAESVVGRLDVLLAETSKRIKRKTGQLLKATVRDYRAAIITPQMQQLSEQEETIRRRVAEIIQTAEALATPATGTARPRPAATDVAGE